MTHDILKTQRRMRKKKVEEKLYSRVNHAIFGALLVAIFLGSGIALSVNNHLAQSIQQNSQVALFAEGGGGGTPSKSSSPPSSKSTPGTSGRDADKESPGAGSTRGGDKSPGGTPAGPQGRASDSFNDKNTPDPKGNGVNNGAGTNPPGGGCSGGGGCDSGAQQAARDAQAKAAAQKSAYRDNISKYAEAVSQARMQTIKTNVDKTLSDLTNALIGGRVPGTPPAQPSGLPSGYQPTDPATLKQMQDFQNQTGLPASQMPANFQADDTVEDLTRAAAEKAGVVSPNYGPTKPGEVPKPTDARVPLNNLVRSNPNITVKANTDLMHVKKDTISQVLNTVNITGQKITITAGQTAEGHKSHDDTINADGTYNKTDPSEGTAIDVKLDVAGLSPAQVRAKTENFVKTLSAQGVKNIGVYNEPGKLHVDNAPRTYDRKATDVPDRWGWGSLRTSRWSMEGWRQSLVEGHIAGTFNGYGGVTPDNALSKAAANNPGTKSAPETKPGDVNTPRETPVGTVSVPTPRQKPTQTPPSTTDVNTPAKTPIGTVSVPKPRQKPTVTQPTAPQIVKNQPQIPTPKQKPTPPAQDADACGATCQAGKLIDAVKERVKKVAERLPEVAGDTVKTPALGKGGDGGNDRGFFPIIQTKERASLSDAVASKIQILFDRTTNPDNYYSYIDYEMYGEPVNIYERYLSYDGVDYYLELARNSTGFIYLFVSYSYIDVNGYAPVYELVDEGADGVVESLYINDENIDDAGMLELATDRYQSVLEDVVSYLK